MDQLVRIDAVLRERRDAERHRCADRLGRGLHLELALGDGAADALRDLHCLLGRSLRQEDRELLASEPRRHVVVAQLLTEDLGDSLEDRVAGEVAVAVVDVAQEVEVGHDQRHRPLEAAGARDLRGERRGEIARVIETGLRVDARLGLELRDAERPVDDDERREGRKDEPRVPVPERRERDAEDRQHEVDRDALGREQPGLTERVVAAEPQDHGNEDVVHRHEGDACGEPGDREAQVRVRNQAGPVKADQVGDAPRRESVERVVRDVEDLDRPRVALLQPLRDRLHERDEDDQLRREEQRRGHEEHDRRVVHQVPRRLHGEHLRHRRRRRENDERHPVVLDARGVEIELAGRGQRHDSERNEVEPRSARQPGGLVIRVVVRRKVEDELGGERLRNGAHCRFSGRTRYSQQVPFAAGIRGRRAMRGA